LTEYQWAQAERIDGWLGKEEARFLFVLVSGPWCEVGCYKGRSTVVLAQTHHPGYAIDHFKGSPEMPDGTNTYAEFMENIGPYTNVTVMPYKFRGAAAMVSDDLNLVFLDADHSYEETFQAFQLYAPKVERGGHVALHDAKGGGWPGVEEFVAELRGNQAWRELPAVEHTIAFKKR
jgi:predicted O-methyltransferase YrrM